MVMNRKVDGEKKSYKQWQLRLDLERSRPLRAPTIFSFRLFFGVFFLWKPLREKLMNSGPVFFFFLVFSKRRMESRHLKCFHFVEPKNRMLFLFC